MVSTKCFVLCAVVLIITLELCACEEPGKGPCGGLSRAKCTAFCTSKGKTLNVCKPGPKGCGCIGKAAAAPPPPESSADGAPDGGAEGSPDGGAGGSDGGAGGSEGEAPQPE
jgi:hypothetical protein